MSWSFVTRLLVCVLFLACLTLLTPIEAADNTAKSTKKSSSAKSSTIAKDGGNDQSPEALRLARKQTRMETTAKRLTQWETRATDRATKAKQRHAKSAQSRADKQRAKLKKQKKLIEASEAYWKRKRESQEPAVLAKGRDRLQSMLSLAEAAIANTNTGASSKKKPSSALLEFGSKQLPQHLTIAPRPYWTLIALTALDSKYKCDICQRAHSALVPLASEVHRHSVALYGNNTDASITALSLLSPIIEFNASVPINDRERLQREIDDKLKSELPVFVVELDIDSNRQLFNELQLSSAPVIVLLPPVLSTVRQPTSQMLDSLPGKYRYIPQSLDIDPQHIKSFINNFLTHKIGASEADSLASTQSLSLTQQLMEKLIGSVAGLQATWRRMDTVIQSFATVIVTMLALFAINLLYRLYTSTDSRSLGLIGFFFPPIDADAKTVVDSVSVKVRHSHSEASISGNGGEGVVVNDRDTVTTTTVTVTPPLFPPVSASRLPSMPLTSYPLFVSALCFYFLCISGGVFTLIKDSDRGYRSLVDVWRKGGATVSNQYMEQTVAESALMASLYAFTAAVIAMASIVAFRRVTVTIDSTSTTSRQKFSTIVNFLFSTVFSPLVLALLAFVLYCQIVNIYGKKTNYQWGVNWNWLKGVDWAKVIPYPPFHRHLGVVWQIVKNRLI